MTMDSQSFEYLAAMIKEKSGICLSEDKAYLVESRLLPIIRDNDISDLNSLVSTLKTGGNDKLVNEIIEAMTTNETYFFRDTKPFEMLVDDMIPAIAETMTPDIKIWSAACSFGQEPYSIIIKLLENEAVLKGKSFEITATDIDNKVLEKAKEGLYTQFDVQRGMPIATLMKFFSQKDTDWQINDDVKKYVTFSQLNLLANFDVTMMKKFDIVYCRNVLIYFDPETKKQILDKICSVMKPDGFLCLGSAEQAKMFTDSFEQHEGINGLFRPAKKDG